MLVPPSMARLYGFHTDVRGFLGIGLSQSGRTIEVAETLSELRSSGAVTIAITSDRSSPVAAAADLVLDLETGDERAVPATKTFTAELALLTMVAESLGDFTWSRSAWEAMIEEVAGALDDERVGRALAASLDGVEHLSVIGSGAALGIAHEIALKLMEVAGIAASAFSCESFRHGPVRVAGPHHPVIAVVIPGPAGDDARRTCASLTGVPTITLGDDRSTLPDALAIIPVVVRGQQLALEIAQRRGADPDHPPRIQKVTSL